MTDVSAQLIVEDVAIEVDGVAGVVAADQEAAAPPPPAVVAVEELVELLADADDDKIFNQDWQQLDLDDLQFATLSRIGRLCPRPSCKVIREDVRGGAPPKSEHTISIFLCILI